MEKINYALVGFGGIAKTHAIGSYTANLTLGLPYCISLKNIVTRKPMEYCIQGSENVTDIEQVLNDPDIQFIDICTPNDAHKELVEKAAEYGKAIYCEKPLAANYYDALEMTEIINKKGIRNAAAFMYRFMPAIRLIKAEIENKTIGDIIDFKVNLYHKSYLDSNKKSTWRTSEASGGGALLDLGVHLVDIIHFTLGSIETVDCKTRIFFKERTNVDEIAACDFTLDNGTAGSLEVSRIYADMEEPTTFSIYGTRGSIKMNTDKPYSIDIYDFEKNSTITRTAKGNKDIMRNYPSERSSMGFHQDCHMASLVNFADEIYYGKKGSITPTFNDALKAQKVIEAAYVSARENRKYNIEEINK